MAGVLPLLMWPLHVSVDTELPMALPPTEDLYEVQMSSPQEHTT